MTKKQTIEVARSFSKTVQVKQYEPINVFASRKAECSKEEAAAVSAELFAECVKEVEESIYAYQHPEEQPLNTGDPEVDLAQPLGMTGPVDVKTPMGEYICRKCQPVPFGDSRAQPGGRLLRIKDYCELNCDGCNFCGTDAHSKEELRQQRMEDGIEDKNGNQLIQR